MRRLWIPVCPECGERPGLWSGMIRASDEPDAHREIYCLEHEDEDRELRPQCEWREVILK